MFLSNFRLKTAVQRLLCNLAEIADYPRMHPGRELQREALRDSVEYLEALPVLPLAFPTARELMKYSLEHVTKPGPVVELGVFKGATIRYIAAHVPEGTVVDGFDSFQGLPAAWSGNQSTFDAHGALPRVPSNVRLHVGMFDDSVPEWVQDQHEPLAFLHVDCDVYESASSGLTAVAPLIAPGTIILFDEYFNYPGWRQHEFRAFQEFVAERSVNYRYLGYSRIGMAVMIDEIHPLGGGSPPDYP